MIYADPGSGAMIWQLGLALFFGGAFFFARAKEWARGIFKKNEPEASSKAPLAVSLVRPPTHASETE